MVKRDEICASLGGTPPHLGPKEAWFVGVLTIWDDATDWVDDEDVFVVLVRLERLSQAVTLCCGSYLQLSHGVAAHIGPSPYDDHFRFGQYADIIVDVVGNVPNFATRNAVKTGLVRVDRATKIRVRNISTPPIFFSVIVSSISIVWRVAS